MILKGRARAHGQQLASYLLSPKNEQVRVLDLQGTIADDCSASGLKQSLHEMEELGKMTRAQSSLFHLAINPNDRDSMTPDGWKHSVSKAEKALNLEGQPRVIVSHIYEGKEHLHVVWSRVDVEQRKCVGLSFSNLKLCKAAREIEIELGLEQTPERKTRTAKQQNKDVQKHQDERTATPRAQLNATLETAWHQSQNGQEFKTQIEAAGYQLAIGNRGVLVMDESNNTHSISRCVEGIKTKDVRAKLGDLQNLPTVEEVRKTKTRQTETEEVKSAQLTRRQASQTTERELDMKPQAETSPETPDPTTRRAQNLAAPQAQRELAANDNKKSDDEKQKRPLPKRLSSETDAQYAARVKRVQEYIDRAKEQPKHELHLKPKGPSFG